MNSTVNPLLSNRVSLGPGESVFNIKGKGTIWMVLGSCLGIIMYHPSSKKTAACHAQLPTNFDAKDECFSKCPVKCMQVGKQENSYRYVNCCFNNMKNSFLRKGIELNELKFYIYGGSDVLQITTQKTVGSKNIEMMDKLIAENNLNIVERNVGGKRGRTILFDIETGKTTIKMQRNHMLDGEEMFAPILPVK